MAFPLNLYSINPIDLKRGIISERYGYNQNFVDSIKYEWQKFKISKITEFVRSVKYLILKGVNSSRLRATGFADQWPVGVDWVEMRSGNITLEVIAEKNSTSKLKQKNRRIKIIIDP